jgi:hypothetical protein
LPPEQASAGFILELVHLSQPVRGLRAFLIRIVHPQAPPGHPLRAEHPLTLFCETSAPGSLA